ncbi:lichenicidin A2 family type 2 lantibiotic [Staphylococcus pseudintermedius]|uniref:lichenicidin A2 family type 2 lantibiotic n=1 Tax=Staphylococcus pseudintermedius TaxID=283734 RepID=UPI001A3254EA|nr:lichenicidin A2 family type 2 lantibiotic [Staphylococcus pseudintermedius]MBJ8269004.1 lichenicidin A2 family type 2 lantibiotic [Staphylococcus pseudintermedius]
MKNETIVGKSFMELDQAEMDFISGAEGTVDVQVTPSSVLCVRISLGVSAAGASFVASYVASAATNCD